MSTLFVYERYGVGALWCSRAMDQQDGTADHAGEGLIEADAADLPLVICLVEADIPGADPAEGADIPVEGAGDADLVWIGRAERDGEAEAPPKLSVRPRLRSSSDPPSPTPAQQPTAPRRWSVQSRAMPRTAA
jgi:hypothetical protein